MIFNELTSALSGLIDIFVEWVEYVRHPFLACDRLLVDYETDQVRLKRAMKIWLSSFIISVVVLTPLYNRGGIGLATLGFHLSLFFFVTLALLLTSGAIHIGLLWDGVKSRFGDTLLIYSLFFGTFSPLFSLLSYPSLAILFSSLKVSKAQHLGSWETAVAVSKAFSSPSPIAAIPLQFEHALTVVASLALSGMFAEAVAKYYQKDRHRILSSMSFSIAVLGIVPGLICAWFYYYVVFSFV
jgi:hypothetical protein